MYIIFERYYSYTMLFIHFERKLNLFVYWIFYGETIINDFKLLFLLLVFVCWRIAINEKHEGTRTSFTQVM